MNPLGVSVLVAGVGARTAVGMTAAATAAAVRAAVAGFSQHPFMVDGTDKPMVVASCPALEIDLSGAERLAELAGPAVVEAVAPLIAAELLEQPVPTFIGLPAPRPGRPTAVATTVTNRIWAELTGAGFPDSPVRTFETGHAAGAMAVQAAWEAVRGGSTEFALAGGVDSYLEPETLLWLEANDQIHGAGPHNNAWGFIPGEAAGFVLLAAADRPRVQPAVLEMLTAATTRETKLIKTDAVCLGAGLTELFRTLGRALPRGTLIDHVYCDLNGEPYRADEFGFAMVREKALFRDGAGFQTPAACWGDVGAAAGPLFLMLADAAARKGYAPGPVSAAFTSAEGGERCGFVARTRGPRPERR